MNRERIWSRWQSDKPAGAVVEAHLRELPDVALWAALDVAKTGGPWALIELITDEWSNRNRSANRLKQP